MKKYLIIITGFVFIIASCNQKGTHDNKKATPDKSILLSNKYNIPSSLKHEAENGKINSRSYNGTFSDVSAKFSIQYNTIQIDSLNSYISSVEVVLDRGCENCLFKASLISPQLNSQTDNWSTYVTIQIEYTGYTGNIKVKKFSNPKIIVIKSEGKPYDLSNGVEK